MKHSIQVISLLFIGLLMGSVALGQDTAKKAPRELKNIIRYDLSGGLLFGVDRYVVFGYERVVTPHQSFSVNIGGAGLPRLAAIATDSFYLTKDAKNNGYNVSVDYRFYLAKENKYLAPHGLYIGPYASFTNFHRTNDWEHMGSGGNQDVIQTTTNFKILTFGAELGYQFILWRRVALDLVMVGPGISNYDLKAEIKSNLTDAQRTQLQSAIKQVIDQKLPGMNYIMSDQTFNANGIIRTWSVGYRYIMHIGFVF